MFKESIFIKGIITTLSKSTLFSYVCSFSVFSNELIVGSENTLHPSVEGSDIETGLRFGNLRSGSGSAVPETLRSSPAGLPVSQEAKFYAGFVAETSERPLSSACCLPQLNPHPICVWLLARVPVFLTYLPCLYRM